MNLRLIIPLLLFLAGVGAVSADVVAGDAEVSLFLVFPVFSGSSGLFLLGVGLIVSGIFAWFATMFHASIPSEAANAPSAGAGGVRDNAAKKTRVGGVVLIGPIPIAYGSDARMAFTMIVLAAFAVAVMILLLVFL